MKHPTSFSKKLPKYPDPALQPKDTNLLKVKNINTAEMKPRAGQTQSFPFLGFYCGRARHLSTDLRSRIREGFPPPPPPPSTAGRQKSGTVVSRNSIFLSWQNHLNNALFLFCFFLKHI